MYSSLDSEVGDIDHTRGTAFENENVELLLLGEKRVAEGGAGHEDAARQQRCCTQCRHKRLE